MSERDIRINVDTLEVYGCVTPEIPPYITIATDRGHAISIGLEQFRAFIDALVRVRDFLKD